jgi:Caspase domain
MSVRPVDPGRSRIVLVGTPAYEDPGLPDVPVVAANVRDLNAVFTDPGLGGFDAEHCVTVPAGAGVAHVGKALTQAAAEAEDLLLFYYSGHGLLGARRRELYLTLAGTRVDQLAFTALPFEAVRDACLDSRATSRVVILDSCYSGRAIGETLSDAAEVVLGQVQVQGTYTLTSAPANRTASFLPGEGHTAFTERLLALLLEGSAQAGEMITLGDIYRDLLGRLSREGLPVPQQRGTGRADLLGLVRNRRYEPARGQAGSSQSLVVPEVVPEVLRAGLDSRYPRLRVAAVQELGDWLGEADAARAAAARTVLAQVAAQDVPSVAGIAGELLREWAAGEGQSAFGRAAVVSEPAFVHVPQPPSRPVWDESSRRLLAVPILDRVERIAEDVANLGPAGRRSWDLTMFAPVAADNDLSRYLPSAERFPDLRRMAEALVRVAPMVAGSDPDRALRLVEAITFPRLKETALVGVAPVVAGSDLDRALRLVETIIDPGLKAMALVGIAPVVAGSDPDRALHLVETITERKEWALVGIAPVVAASDPDRALRIADTITDSYWKSKALAEVAKVVARSDPNRGRRIAKTITDPVWKSVALVGVAPAVAGSNPNRALRIAKSITSQGSKTLALAGVAKVVAASDPDRALRLVETITDPLQKAMALLGIAPVVAGSDPGRALRLVETITDPVWKSVALAGVAKVVADSDTVRALYIAETITDPSRKAQALAEVARVLAGSDRPQAEKSLHDAEQVADGITDLPQRAEVLAQVTRAWLDGN